MRPAVALFLDWKHVKCVPPLPHTAFNALGAVESPAALEGTLTPPLGFPSSTLTELLIEAGEEIPPPAFGKTLC